MGQEIATFGDIKIKKRKFPHHKTLILLKHEDIEKLQVPIMVPSSGKQLQMFYWLQRR